MILLLEFELTSFLQARIEALEGSPKPKQTQTQTQLQPTRKRVKVEEEEDAKPVIKREKLS